MTWPREPLSVRGRYTVSVWNGLVEAKGRGERHPHRVQRTSIRKIRDEPRVEGGHLDDDPAHSLQLVKGQPHRIPQGRVEQSVGVPGSHQVLPTRYGPLEVS